MSRKHVLVVLAYIVATLLAQGTSHFAINAEHYAGLTFFRPDPVVAFGLTSMAIQGGICAAIYSRLVAAEGTSMRHALGFAWMAGAILVSYIAIALAGEYRLPSIGRWIAVEAMTGLAQFTLFGILLGVIYRRA